MTYTYHRPGINWRYQQTKYSFAMGAAVQQASLKVIFILWAKDSSIIAPFLISCPMPICSISINQYKNIRAVYNTFTRQPSVTQLQPLADNTDPLNIKIGNPDLKQEYYHRLQANIFRLILTGIPVFLPPLTQDLPVIKL